jgi:hypothetical protein
LHRKYGKWPIEEFAALSAERKTEFYEELKSQTSKEFTSTLTKTLMVQRLEETGHRDIGEFLPLDVWGKRGWDTEVIRTTSHVGNTRDCDRFGKLYKVNIHADISRLTLAEVSKDLAVIEGRAKNEGMSKKEQVEGKRKVEKINQRKPKRRKRRKRRRPRRQAPKNRVPMNRAPHRPTIRRRRRRRRKRPISTTRSRRRTRKPRMPRFR